MSTWALVTALVSTKFNWAWCFVFRNLEIEFKIRLKLKKGSAGWFRGNRNTLNEVFSFKQGTQNSIFYPKGYSYLKLYCKKQGNQKPTVNVVSTARRTTLCWVRSNIKNFYSSNLSCISPSLLETNLNKAKYNVYKKLSRSHALANCIRRKLLITLFLALY